LNARALFVGPDGRARAPWRLLLFLILSAACVIVVVIGLQPVLAMIERAVGIEGTAESYGTVIALLLAHWMTFRSFDQRPWSFAWLHRDAARPRALGQGWLLGGLPIGLMSLALVAAGLLDIQRMPDGSWTRVAIQTGLLLLPAAFYEELLSRGYIFATLAEWLGRFWAVALTSVGFGLLHLWNPGASVLSIVLVTLAGVYLAVVLLATNSMYAAWMAHWAWNWVMAAFLHVPVSGLPLDRPDYQIVDSGPDWVTGGAWGPEGGAAGAAGMLGVLAYLYWRRRRTTTTNDTVER
jgi:membrane protease YdiL (CAAX protease family)